MEKMKSSSHLVQSGIYIYISFFPGGILSRGRLPLFHQSLTKKATVIGRLHGGPTPKIYAPSNEQFAPENRHFDSKGFTSRCMLQVFVSGRVGGFCTTKTSRRL